MDEKSLSPSRQDCKYHIVFAVQFRRQEIHGKIRAGIGKILKELCGHKGVEIIRAEACPYHIQMLVSIPPQKNVSSSMGYLKGHSIFIIFEQHGNLQHKYGNRRFWCKGILCEHSRTQ